MSDAPKDAADLVKDGRGEALAAALDAAQPALDCRLARIAANLPADPPARLPLLDSILPDLARIDDRLRRDLMADKVAEVFKLKAPQVRARLADLIKEYQAAVRPDEPAGAGVGAAAPDAIERDGGLHRAVVACIREFLEARDLRPDGTNGWRHKGRPAGVKDRHLISEFLYQYASRFESISAERVKWTLGGMVLEARAARKQEVVEQFIGRPASSDGLEAAKAWIQAVTGKEDPVDLAVLLHFLWQVKRHAAGLPVEHDLMPVLFGREHGSGKTHAIRRLTKPWSEFAYPISATTLTDTREREALSDYLIGVWDELSGGSKAEVAALKHAVTSDLVAGRNLHTQDHSCLPRRMTLIASSNDPVSDIIADTGGARRFYEWHAKAPRLDWDSLNALDPLVIWSAVSEQDPAPFHQVADAIRERQVDLRHRDSVDLWLECEAFGELRVMTGPAGEFGPPPSRCIPAFSHGRGESIQDLLCRWKNWAAQVGQPAIQANRLAALLRQRGWHCQRPRAEGSRARAYFMPTPVPTWWAAAYQDHLVHRPAVDAPAQLVPVPSSAEDPDGNPF
jgi:hypothetical protein